jgi:hypothetical protein
MDTKKAHATGAPSLLASVLLSPLLAETCLCLCPAPDELVTLAATR